MSSPPYSFFFTFYVFYCIIILNKIRKVKIKKGGGGDFMDVVDLINTLGYPAAITIGMGYFLKYVFDRNSKVQDDIIKVIENNTEALAAFKEELENLAHKDREESKNENI